MGRHSQQARRGGGQLVEDPDVANTIMNMPVANATVISLYDLLWYDESSNTVKPASSLPNQGSLVNNQVLFASKWAGVALAPHANGGGNVDIPVQIYGPATMAILSATVNVGDLIGPTALAGFFPLSNTTVVGVNSTDLAIGRSTTHGAAQTSVTPFIGSTLMFGGIAPPA